MSESHRPQEGTWTLTAPDGQVWLAESPLKCAAAESRARVPARIALERIYAAADAPTELEKEMLAALQGLLNALPSATTHPAIKAARSVIAKVAHDQP